MAKVAKLLNLVEFSAGGYRKDLILKVATRYANNQGRAQQADHVARAHANADGEVDKVIKLRKVLNKAIHKVPCTKGPRAAPTVGRRGLRPGCRANRVGGQEGRDDEGDEEDVDASAAETLPGAPRAWRAHLRGSTARRIHTQV